MSFTRRIEGVAEAPMTGEQVSQAVGEEGDVGAAGEAVDEGGDVLGLGGAEALHPGAGAAAGVGLGEELREHGPEGRHPPVGQAAGEDGCHLLVSRILVATHEAQGVA